MRAEDNVNTSGGMKNKGAWACISERETGRQADGAVIQPALSHTHALACVFLTTWSMVSAWPRGSRRSPETETFIHRRSFCFSDSLSVN